MVNNLATSPSFIANSTACRHLAMTPLLVQSQTRNPPTCFQFHRGRFHGIDRLVALLLVLVMQNGGSPDAARPPFMALSHREVREWQQQHATTRKCPYCAELI